MKVEQYYKDIQDFIDYYGELIGNIPLIEARAIVDLNNRLLALEKQNNVLAPEQFLTKMNDHRLKYALKRPLFD